MQTNRNNIWKKLDAIRKKPSRIVIGLMSGTSLDGIDAVIVRIHSEPFKVETLEFDTTLYTALEKTTILEVCTNNKTDSQKISVLNASLGKKFAKAAILIAKKAGVLLKDIDFIGSHGQTIWHQPDSIKLPGFCGSSTLQIGDGNVISVRTGLPTVSDFRSADMALGGQGAPLVPYADWLLFKNENEPIITLNIGGIAIITYIPKNAIKDEVIAFDTGPGNMLIDLIVKKRSNGKKTFDEDGKLAREGIIDAEIIERELYHPYFLLRPPKSTGREMFGKDYLKSIITNYKDTSICDIAATLTELTAATIAKGMMSQLNDNFSHCKVIVSGGGAKNSYLLERIKYHVPFVRIINSEEYGINPDAKEAIAFAILADAFMRGESAGMPSVTGASSSVMLGKLSLP